ncbi:hypothetical protein BH11BAC4_BH11BAC4_24700 [soil metagenome]
MDTHDCEIVQSGSKLSLSGLFQLIKVFNNFQKYIKYKFVRMFNA